MNILQQWAPAGTVHAPQSQSAEGDHHSAGKPIPFCEEPRDEILSQESHFDEGQYTANNVSVALEAGSLVSNSQWEDGP